MRAEICDQNRVELLRKRHNRSAADLRCPACGKFFDYQKTLREHFEKRHKR